MKYHAWKKYEAFQGGDTQWGKYETYCGLKVSGAGEHFIYDREGFLTHFDGENRCKSCARAIAKDGREV